MHPILVMTCNLREISGSGTNINPGGFAAMITWQPGPSGLVKNSSKEPNELELRNLLVARVTDEILGILALKGGPPRESGGSIAQPPSHTHLFMEF
ncbi:hypothetical protein BDDG_02832 [Blastomyces dermatitidis ATCC 18188]|uniref:Uncharacterized protein n=1 Tax=Ajellomyces dermatitidis (strain ATCC 18188 / CBS 674.68) TaxID=653446 RepID=F2T9H8_AJEDA|nr:hypothetical protein BDDG_02832 [Blastomyces dermatitidis ATCC 18188]